MTWSCQNSVLHSSAITTATLGLGNSTRFTKTRCRSEWMLEETVFSLYIYIYNIHMICCPVGNNNNHAESNSQYSALPSPSKSTWLLRQGPSHLQECPGPSALAGMAARAPAHTPQESSNLKDNFILAIRSPYGKSSAFQAKVLQHLTWKLTIPATASIIYFISKVI